MIGEPHKGEDGKWRDVVHWKNREFADMSESKIDEIEVCRRFIGMMDCQTMTVKHFTLVSS